MQASTVSVDDCGSQGEDVASGGDAAGVLIGASLGVCRKRAIIDSIVIRNRGAVRRLIHVHVLTMKCAVKPFSDSSSDTDGSVIGCKQFFV